MPLDPFGTIQKKNIQSTTSRSRATYAITASGKLLGTPSVGDNVAQAHNKGLRFWQPRSNAEIVYNSVLADCIYKEISQKRGERTIFERLSLPRPAPKREYSKVLGKRSSSTSSKTLVKVHLLAPGNRCAKLIESRKRIKAARQETQRHAAPGNWKREMSQTVEKEPEFKVDLRIEGIAHDVILKDVERMGKIQEVAEN